MPVPTQCQHIADEITTLEGERESVKGLTTHEKWAALHRNALILKQITQKRAQLEQCVASNTTGYETEVVVLDVTGAAVLPADGRLWNLAPPATQAVVESKSVHNGRISFVHAGSIPNRSIGISIHEGANPTFNGPLFRSGPFASLPPGSPGDPAGLIEIGIVAGVPVSSAALMASLPPASSIPVPTGVAVTSVALSLGSGTATLLVGATLTASLGFLGPLIIPFTYALTFAIAPSFNMNVVTEVCVLTPTGAGSITTPLGGVANFILGFIAPSIEPMLTTTVVGAVQGALNSIIIATAATAVGLPALPAGVVVSMRRIVITPAGVSLFPAVGAYGGLLNKISFP